MLRTCVYCDETKSYDPTAKRESAAMGFVGYTCVPCHRLKAKLAKYNLDITESNAIAQYTELKAQRALSRAQDPFKPRAPRKPAKPKFAPLSKPYGEVVREAQSALDQFDAEYPYELDSQHRSSLVYALNRAEHKAKLFGVTAFDVKSTKKAKTDND